MPIGVNGTTAGWAQGMGLLATLLLGAGLSLATAPLTTTQAHAQGFFSFWDQPAAPRKVRRSFPAPSDDDHTVKVPESETKSVGPLVINVSIDKQRLAVYDQTGLIAEAPVSTGQIGYPTPTGVFSILEKNEIHHSNLYGGAPMPNMQRLTMSGVALHAGQLPGYPASHGCIRLPYGFSKKLFGMTELGARVIVSYEPVTPAPIVSSRLFKAYPPETVASTDAAQPTRVADASGTTVGTSVVSADATARPTYRERRLREIASLTAALRTAGYKAATAKFDLVQATRDLDTARAKLKAAKAEADERAGATRKAKNAKGEIDDDLAAVTRRIASGRKMNDDDKAEAIEKKQTLEEKSRAATDTLEAARRDEAPAAEAVKAAAAGVDDAEAKRKAAVAAVAEAQTAIADAIAADEGAKRREAKRAYPASVLISRATGKLYVRQGYEPTLEVPVTFTDADQPIGTHVFTALHYTPSKTDLTWTVASIATPPGPVPQERRRRQARVELPAPEVDKGIPQTAEMALERVQIPDEVREQVADIMKPGSSVIISDYGTGYETGKFTDFIIQTRGAVEPYSASSGRSGVRRKRVDPGPPLSFW